MTRRDGPITIRHRTAAGGVELVAECGEREVEPPVLASTRFGHHDRARFLWYQKLAADLSLEHSSMQRWPWLGATKRALSHCANMRASCYVGTFSVPMRQLAYEPEGTLPDAGEAEPKRVWLAARDGHETRVAPITTSFVIAPVRTRSEP